MVKSPSRKPLTIEVGALKKMVFFVKRYLDQPKTTNVTAENTKKLDSKELFVINAELKLQLPKLDVNAWATYLWPPRSLIFGI